MARLGQIDLCDRYVSGGAYKLENSPTESRTPGVSLGDSPQERSEIELSDGWKATLAEETSYIVVQSKSEIKSEEIFEETFDAATRALDIFSILKDFEGECEDPHNDNILWWIEDGNKHIQKTGIANLTGGATAKLTAEGESSERTVPEWQESFRYYRLSQTTSDVFDAYRNQFLALEHLLSDICPKNPGERDTDWLERALQKAHQRHDLSNHVSDQSDPVDSILENHWRNVRCQLFHSKTGFDRLEPRSSDDVHLVRTELENLTKIYSHLVSRKFGRSLGTGGMTHYMFKLSMEDLLQQTEIAISSDTSEWDRNTELSDISPVSEFHPARYDKHISDHNVQQVIAKIDINNIDHSQIRRFALVKRNETDEDGVMVYSNLSNELDIGGFDTLLIRQGVRHITGSRSDMK